MTKVVTAYIVCADMNEAETIAETLVGERLAACVNILGDCSSVYRWEGKVERSTEVAMIAKTTDDAVASLIPRVKALHSYDNPAITIWPITGLSGDYADWVEGNVGGK